MGFLINWNSLKVLIFETLPTLETDVFRVVIKAIF